MAIQAIRRPLPSPCGMDPANPAHVDPEAAIGEQLRELRLFNKLALKEVSEKVGISVGYLSQLGRNHSISGSMGDRASPHSRQRPELFIERPRRRQINLSKGPPMISYITLGSNDLEAAGHFYDAVLAPLGYSRQATQRHEIGYGTTPKPSEAANIPLWITRPFDGRAATAGNGVDVAFAAPSRAAIDAFHAAALALGGKDEGAPGLRPAYGPHFYTAYVRDLDGNKLNAVFRLPPG